MEGRCEIATAVTPSALYIRPLIAKTSVGFVKLALRWGREVGSQMQSSSLSPRLYTRLEIVFMGFGEFSRQTDPISFVAILLLICISFVKCQLRTISWSQFYTIILTLLSLLTALHLLTKYSRPFRFRSHYSYCNTNPRTYREGFKVATRCLWIFFCEPCEFENTSSPFLQGAYSVCFGALHVKYLFSTHWEAWKKTERHLIF